MTKYEKIMESIKLTEESKNRIKNNVKKEESKIVKFKSRISVRKWLNVAAIFILVIGASTILSSNFSHLFFNPTEKQIENSLKENNDGLNSITEASSAKELSKISGIEINDINFFNNKSTITNYNSLEDIAEILYNIDNQQVSYRKAKIGLENISGIYEEFEKETIKNKDLNITLNLSKDKIFLIEWENDGYQNSVYIPNGISRDEVNKIFE